MPACPSRARPNLPSAGAHAHTHTQARTHTNTYAHTRARARTHAPAHAPTREHGHAHASTRTHTPTQWLGVTYAPLGLQGFSSRALCCIRPSELFPKRPLTHSLTSLALKSTLAGGEGVLLRRFPLSAAPYGPNVCYLSTAARRMARRP